MHPELHTTALHHPIRFLWAFAWRFSLLCACFGAVFGFLWGLAALLWPMLSLVIVDSPGAAQFMAYMILVFAFPAGFLWGLIMGLIDGFFFASLHLALVFFRLSVKELGTYLFALLYGWITPFIFLLVANYALPQSLRVLPNLPYEVGGSLDGRWDIFSQWLLCSIGFAASAILVSIWIRTGKTIRIAF